MRGFEGRVGLVTGAGRGIGRAIARRLAVEGAAVVINDLDLDAAEQVAAELTDAGRAAVAASGSVADLECCASIVAAAENEFGALDIVVNNAGLTADSWLGRMSDETWATAIDIMLTGPFQLCRSAARLLRAPSSGHHRKVVNICSVNGIYGAAGQANYCAAKAGLVGLTKALAREWAGDAINVNAVAPGYVAGTRLTSPRRADGRIGLPDTAIKKLEASMPIGRPGTPEDIAGVVAFLASADADYVVGQVIEVHGGREIIEVG